MGLVAHSGRAHLLSLSVPLLDPSPFFIYLFICFGCVGSSLLCVGFLSSCSDQGLLFVVVRRLLSAVASLVEHRPAPGARPQ